jgi:AcrR family transcriptional regulator
MVTAIVNTRRYGDNGVMARTTSGTGVPRRGTPTLTASDWAEAALQLVAESGLDALTVSHLATRLGVTKGSFYWHFNSRDDLLAAALERWQQRATVDTMKALDEVPDPRTRLELILGAASQPPRARSLYASLAQAAGHPLVRKALSRVATARIAYLETCDTAMGLSASDARARAVFAYAAYRGVLQLAHEAPASLPADWDVYAALVKAQLVPKKARG